MSKQKMTSEEYVRHYHPDAYAEKRGFWTIYMHPDLSPEQAFLGSAITKRDAWRKAAQAIIDQRWRTLECVDCGTKIKAPLRQAYELIRSHVRMMHGRDPLFTEEQYADKRVAELGNVLLTTIKNPELIVCA